MTSARSLRLFLVLLLGACGEPAPRDLADERADEPSEASRAAGLRVAVTVDDVPWTSRSWAGLDREAETRRLLATLTERGIPFAAFVTCDGLRPGRDLLQMWIEAGAAMGNHTYNHRDLNTAPLAAWLEDVRSCHAVIGEAAGEPPRYFRYPYLHRGPTTGRKAAAAALLDSLGYVDAPVTIDNSEWVLAGAYGDAPPDSVRDARFRSLYVEHMVGMLRHFRDLARERTGGDPAHVLLIHANALNARHLGAVLDAYAAEEVEFVSLREALEDPLYHRPDAYVGRDGLSWIYRIPPVPPDAGSFDQAEENRLRSELRSLGRGSPLPAPGRRTRAAGGGARFSPPALRRPRSRPPATARGGC